MVNRRFLQLVLFAALVMSDVVAQNTSEVPAFWISEEAGQEVRGRTPRIEWIKFEGVSGRIRLRDFVKWPKPSAAASEIRGEIQMQWLVPGKVLWVSWQTVWPGSGAYTAEAHVLVDVADGIAKELLRESYLIVAAGVPGFSGSVTYSCDSEQSRVSVTVIEMHRCHDSVSLPFAGDEAPGGYYQEYTVREQASFRREDDTLVESRCEVYLELGERTFTAGKVAEQMVLILAPRWGAQPGHGTCTPVERERMLRAMDMEADAACTGSIRIPKYTPGRLIPVLTPKDDFYPFDM